MPGVRGAQRRGEGPAADADQGSAGVGAAGRVVVAETPAGLAQVLCARRSFTQTSDAIRPWARVTERLRDQVAHAIAGSNRAVAEGGTGVRRVVADRAQGADCRGGPVVAGARNRPVGWGSMRPGSVRSAGCWTGSPGDGRIHG